ncbi:putative C-type lectin domain family 20 member A [Cebidichthys violaceus]|uniref:putative C-type lectin domain family 20 member A n=1 Tax=Cebidichthys violaceus TaxID=271503 RepID=UPI0035C98258
MERRLFGIFLISGLCHFTSSLHHRQYNFINEAKTWLDARQYCRDKHTDLASVNDEEDLQKLPGLIESGVSYAFLGLYRVWGWSLSDADDYKEGEQAHWKWTSGEPLAKQHHCGSIGATGEWFATACNNSLNFSCYDGSKTAPSERFSPGNGTVTWLAAQTYCRERHTDLARVRSRLENEELQRMAKEDPVWIGLTGTSWAWSDGSETSFAPWKPLRPSSNGDCAALKVNSEPHWMIDWDCAEKLPFFCYSAPVRKQWVRLKLTVDSSVDMTDPAVKESVLKWVERKLSDKGATKDVKVSWRKLPEKQENIKEELTEPIEVVCVP